jgi:outer membrane protein OmpA-like peptidoglycan-associated protein
VLALLCLLHAQTGKLCAAPQYVVEGSVVNEATGKPVPSAEVSIINKTNGTINKILTNAEGTFSIVLVPNAIFLISIRHNYYLSSEAIEVNTFSRRLNHFKLHFPIKQLVKGMAFMISNVEFEVNNEKIAASSVEELDKLATLLQTNPSLIVEIAVHTDSRGNDEYNMQLSQLRAETIKKYLAAKGIPQDRLVPKGYGETRLINHCANNVKCSNTEHIANRRVEYVVKDFSLERPYR